MRKVIHSIFWGMIIVFLPLLGSAQLSTPNINNTILNKNLDKTVNTNLSDDPLRDGAFWIVNDGTNSVENIIGSDQSNAI
jgi:hypothetical protein